MLNSNDLNPDLHKPALGVVKYYDNISHLGPLFNCLSWVTIYFEISVAPLAVSQNILYKKSIRYMLEYIVS